MNKPLEMHVTSEKVPLTKTLTLKAILTDYSASKGVTLALAHGPPGLEFCLPSLAFEIEGQLILTT